LPYYPDECCCSESHVFVNEAGSLAIQIYSWAEYHMQVIDLEEDRRDKIYGIQYLPDQRVLLAANWLVSLFNVRKGRAGHTLTTSVRPLFCHES
jgi:hypothetical protein